MIYGSMILENQLEKLTDHANIIQEYYENEVSFLNSIIEYQDKSLITESTDLQVLQEGFMENIAKKIKELIDKFLDWLKKLWSKFTELFKKKVDSEDIKIKNTEKEMKDVDNDNTLSKEQKETKKENIVKHLINFNGNKTKSFRDTHTFIVYNIFPNILGELALKKSKFIIDAEEYMSDNIEELKRLLANLERYTVPSYDELWKTYEKKYCNKFYYDSPEAVLKKYKQQIENYKVTQNELEYYKNEVEKSIYKLKQKLNKLVGTDQETLKLRYSIINKATSITQAEISNATRFVAALSSKVKLQVVEN